ncbi:hypothetical protein PR202_gb10067 [Eleusine coracana subsp. coracana]|uniref:Uncharacterized protein n=1 Tax=Eleusine coracana subsp. coracana TaxID=191504 RepID=A0AAV5EJZ1_ELECO|nr:hypothetical protein QOZ80_2BG0205240 [Eleusine coracana subsp. coracana]GJN22501.1 hypothetical protein PR202_gb10067 [Eleusine coracana subsp. coracana]
MSKRKRGDRASKRPVQHQQSKQHLHLLLDDWERGYSIHRLDVDAFDSDAVLSPKRVTEPPIARIESPHVRSWNFVSHGSKIFAMKPRESSPGVPAFDAHTLALTICPWPSCRADHVIPIFVSVGGKLFLFLEDRTEYLADPTPYDSDVPWSWTAVVDAPPLPFYNAQVSCYAVHPDGRTLFVSAGGGTFSFDADRLEWTHRGDWVLPFDGQAYFDPQLEAWVGLCGDRDKAGHLCSCNVTAEFTRPPYGKLCKDKLFDKKADLHRGAKLVYMGDSKFCLVESMFQSTRMTTWLTGAGAGACFA